MPTTAHKVRMDVIRRMLHRNAMTNLRKIINNTHPADLARLFYTLPCNQQKIVFGLLQSKASQGNLLTKLDTDDLQAIVQSLSRSEMAGILESIPRDDAATLVNRLPGALGRQMLDGMNMEDSHEVATLLQHEPETAGSIMVPDFFTLEQEISAQQAILELQRIHHKVEMVFYLYVVNDAGKLVGTCSLRQLVTVPPEAPLRAFMSTDLRVVQPDTDQEEVARIAALYNLMAVPVADADGRMLGIVTVDDVIDIIRDEATEDMLKMAGAGQTYVETKSIPKSIRIRLPWLFASCLGGVAASIIIGLFETTLNQLTYLAAFIPVVMGMGGNIGTQSSTIVVRGLATERIQVQNFRSVLFKELGVGALTGVIYGVLVGAVAHAGYRTMELAVVVCASVVFTMMLASLVGALLPMVFMRLRVDPAVATGPFVTTSIDIMSVFIYFKMADYFFALS